MKKKLVVLSVLGLVLAPVLVFAQVEGELSGVLDTILRLLNQVVPILIVLAIIWFIVGVIRYVISQDEEAKGKARSMMIYGIIGLAVIVGMWGLVNMLLRTFSVEGGPGAIVPPSYVPVEQINY